jgi:hypothetical protein
MLPPEGWRLEARLYSPAPNISVVPPWGTGRAHDVPRNGSAGAQLGRCDYGAV